MLGSQTRDAERHDADRPHTSFWGLFGWFGTVLGPEKSYYWLAVVYGVSISLLTLALPISVQMLIDTVANTGLIQPVIVLSSVLLALLLLSGLLVALRTHVMELFGRRIYARLSAEIALRAVHADASYFLEGKRDSLFNRFFDIMILQTNVPSLLTGAFTLIFQAVIGFVVVSLYHPYFLIYTLILIGLIGLIWLIWGPGAIRTAIDESYAKYETAHDLEALAENNDFFHSERHIAAALSQTNNRIDRYIQSNRRHFRYQFSQTVALLILYAVGSAALLGIGGYLVILGQLTLGQLVAAELILSVILFGISQFGTYLDQFYEICASVDKLSAFFRIPQEPTGGRMEPPDTPPRIEFDGVYSVRQDGEEVRMDLDIPGGANVVVRDWTVPSQRAFLSHLQAYERPESGWVRLGGEDLADMDPNRLRCFVLVLDRVDIVESTMNTYLDLAANSVSHAEKTAALKLTGLDATVRRLSTGIETPIIPSGWPLSHSELLRLKLAGAIVGKPKVLVLTQIFDLVERRYLDPILEHLATNRDLTLIRFTDDVPAPWADFMLEICSEFQNLIPCSEFRKPEDGSA